MREITFNTTRTKIFNYVHSKYQTFKKNLIKLQAMSNTFLISRTVSANTKNSVNTEINKFSPILTTLVLLLFIFYIDNMHLVFLIETDDIEIIDSKHGCMCSN